MFLRAVLFVLIHVAIIGAGVALWTDNRETAALLVASR
jgi:hypothetical protein